MLGNIKNINSSVGFLIIITALSSGCSHTNITGSAVPERPSELVGEILALNSISLRWSDNSDSETEFAVYRGIDAGYQEIDHLEADRVDYIDSALPTCSTVSYFVVARNRNGDSPPSNRITISLICGDGPDERSPRKY